MHRRTVTQPQPPFIVHGVQEVLSRRPGVKDETFQLCHGIVTQVLGVAAMTGQARSSTRRGAVDELVETASLSRSALSPSLVCRLRIR